MWRIKDVSRMTGVKRDNIQQICDKHDSRYFIFCPEDSRQGRRFFDEEDVLKVALVGQYQKMGYSLTSIKRAFDEMESAEQPFEEITKRQLEELTAKRKELDRQLKFCEELNRASHGRNPKEAVQALLRKRLAEALVDSAKALLIDLDCPMDDSEFESAFQEKLGIGSKDFCNAFLDAPDPSRLRLIENNAAVEEELERYFASLDSASAEEVLTPDSPLIQQVLDNLLRLTGRQTPDEAKEHAEMLAWLLWNKLIEDQYLELFLEIGIGQGAFDFINKAMTHYAISNWKEKEDEGRQAQQDQE